MARYFMTNLSANRPEASATRFESNNTLKLLPMKALLELDTSDLRHTPHMIGIDARKEYSVADLEFSPINLPVIMVEPERDTPGTRARTWDKPIVKARDFGRAFSSFSLDNFGNLSTIIIKNPITPIAIAIVYIEEKKGLSSMMLDSKKPMMPAGIEVIKILTASLEFFLQKISCKMPKIRLR